MKELIGLKAEITNKCNNLYAYGTVGTIIDTTVCSARLLTLASRAVFDRVTNTYESVQEYDSSWVLWSDLDVKHFPIETFIILENDGKTAHFREGEVYRDDKTRVDLGIYQDKLEVFHLINLQTGLPIISDGQVTTLRCRIPTIAKLIQKRKVDDKVRLEAEIETLQNAHIIYEPNQPFYSI